jgi:hypothetical protein
MPSINGFTVVPYGDPALATYIVGDRGLRLSVRKEVAPLLIGFATDYHNTVEPLRPGHTWGHAPRQIPGGSSWSFHAPGIAMDFNADWHPEYKRGTFRTDQVKTIRELLAKYSYAGKSLFRWGGDYRNHGDEMHFELIQSRDNCLAAVRQLQAPVKRRTLRLTEPMMFGDDIKFVQRFNGVTADGWYGPKTVESVKHFQRFHGLVADGVVGPLTWTKYLG